MRREAVWGCAVCRTLVVGACLILVVGGCSSSDTALDSATEEIEQLEGEIETLGILLDDADETIRQQAIELEDARQIADTVIAEGAGWCEEKLAHCEAMLFPDNDEEWPPSSPAVWFPPTPSYVTESDSIRVEVFAPLASEVTIAGTMVDSGGRWVGDNALFIREVPLTEGRNPIDIVADGESFLVAVERDSSLTRRYGRVLDSRVEWSESRIDHFLGIDYGDMDFEPDYGQGDFDPGAVVVEFARLIPTSVAVVTSPYSSKVVLTGEDEIWEYFSYEVSHFDPWHVLLNGDTIIRIEGPIPLGD